MSKSFVARRAADWLAWCALGIVGMAAITLRGSERIPLPEHPRPDFERADWLNLNGTWRFRFDAQKEGEAAGWFRSAAEFEDRIKVPFPWGSPLSGVSNRADVGWYSRSVTVPEGWRGKRVFVVVGACDWLTRGWFAGQEIGTHQGGYTPFALEITPHVRFGEAQELVLRVDDTNHKFKLEGKQGYGPARGIWQTVYLEARAPLHFGNVRFTPQPSSELVKVEASLSSAAPENCRWKIAIRTPDANWVTSTQTVPAGAAKAEFDFRLPKPRLWSLEDPFLYEVELSLGVGESIGDQVKSYFGMREVGVVKLPGLGHPYIALNGRPVYLQMTLDQAYHPEGFYTFPSDAFMRDEILRSRRIGLNAMRVHVKVEIPRKLYWADRLGMLIMADVPNSWGVPDSSMRAEIEKAWEGMIDRDFNHPAIFSWVVFNETWGLKSADGKYAPETQEWVASMYRRTKTKDPTRLVEDNSPCNYDHVETDINSWHQYLPGHAWQEHLAQVSRDTYAGSKWNFIGDRVQGNQPLLNSECGNVWGYEKSTGDVDYSWDYHIMMNEFRKNPKICGWLYTEHHDVINEWNGYFRYDRSDKETGLGWFVPGMSLRDLHAPFYISTGSAMCQDVKPGSKVQVPLWASFMTDKAPSKTLVLRTQLYGWDDLGQMMQLGVSSRRVPFQPWLSRELEPLSVTMPRRPGLVILALLLESETGQNLQRNFCAFRVSDGTLPREEMVRRDGVRLRTVRFAPSTFKSAEWSLKQWDVLEGLKVNGAGHGYFEYEIPWPAGMQVQDVEGAVLRAELSAKQLFGKDRSGAGIQEGDFMLGKGTLDPSLNPNAYPMSDSVRYPSAVRIRVGGEAIGVVDLPDDPADHSGILSWHAQLKDRYLREAGSYGYLVELAIPSEVLAKAASRGRIEVRFEVNSDLPGGLAIYGERFGRYPLDPSISFRIK